jgi:hypothetical protein
LPWNQLLAGHVLTSEQEQRCFSARRERCRQGASISADVAQ